MKLLKSRYWMPELVRTRAKEFFLGVLSTLISIVSAIAICYLLVWLIYGVFG